jgi:hypothetical protein
VGCFQAIDRRRRLQDNDAAKEKSTYFSLMPMIMTFQHNRATRSLGEEKFKDQRHTRVSLPAFMFMFGRRQTSVFKVQTKQSQSF